MAALRLMARIDRSIVGGDTNSQNLPGSPGVNYFSSLVFSSSHL